MKTNFTLTDIYENMIDLIFKFTDPDRGVMFENDDIIIYTEDGQFTTFVVMRFKEGNVIERICFSPTWGIDVVGSCGNTNFGRNDIERFEEFYLANAVDVTLEHEHDDILSMIRYLIKNKVKK